MARLTVEDPEPNQIRDGALQPAGRVPFFGTWHRAYLAVVIVFVIEVSFFYFVSRFFS